MLTAEGCRARQERFLRRLDESGTDGALISEPRDIYYLTGVLPELKVFPYPSLLFLGRGRASLLLTGLAEGEPAVDERIVYPINECYTLNPDNHERLCARVRAGLRAWPGCRLGFQAEGLPHSVARAAGEAVSPGAWIPVDGILRDLQLRKDPDEVTCIRRAIAANQAGYARAAQVIRPGLTELEVLAACQAAAVAETGEPHFYGGDFRCGLFGGPARPRPIEAGELYIIDAWSDVDGYWCDMARTWAVTEPTELQQSVYEHLAAVLRRVPELARVGGDTREFWHTINGLVKEHPHLAAGMRDHVGHGIGLRVHEMPDLNSCRGGVFEAGNVFTCEPGGTARS